ncbi:MAG: transcriptional repressor LexA [Planctomycetaceae bacterium]|nr:transcriptional repressor LexA [Planctomycetaceae bacterium]
MKSRLSQGPMQISPRQLRVLKQIGRLQASHCYSATIGELAQALNLSRATAFEHIAALREKNLLRQSTGRARSLRLTPAGERLLEHSRSLEENAGNDSFAAPNAAQANSLVLAGRVSAGYGIDAIEERTPFSITDHFGPSDELFALQVCGQSMVDAGIHDGDVVICRHAQTAQNGQLVIALLADGQNATLKRFYLDSSAVRLQPANDAFKPILSRDCRIQAIVVGLVRKFPR